VYIPLSAKDSDLIIQALVFFFDGHVVELAAVESLHTLEESWTTQLS
jgi:glycine cleavage system regulatory protein